MDIFRSLRKNYMSNMIGWKAENEIHTENEIFNSRFSVFAYDEHNAYYILTPQRMEKIMYFADVMNCLLYTSGAADE